MAPEPSTAFFSYGRVDGEFALKLAGDLRTIGANVWIDQLDIVPGTPWDRAVEEALTQAAIMLVILSPVSVNSDNVSDEVSFALANRKRVIPLLFRECKVPFRLARIQHIDFRTDYSLGLKALVRALGTQNVLTVGGDRKITNPTSGEIRRALKGLPVDAPFAIYEKSGSGLTYMQTSGTAEEGFVLEYQAGTVDAHFASANSAHSIEEVVQAFVWYAAGDERWRTELSWEQVPV